MWLFAGGVAFIVAIVNLVLTSSGKHKYCGILVFISLSSGLLAMLSQYNMIHEWVQASDMSALMDVVPTMNNALIAAIWIGILLNAIAVFFNYKKFSQ